MFLSLCLLFVVGVVRSVPLALRLLGQCVCCSRLPSWRLNPCTGLCVSLAVSSAMCQCVAGTALFVRNAGSMRWREPHWTCSDFSADNMCVAKLFYFNYIYVFVEESYHRFYFVCCFYFRYSFVSVIIFVFMPRPGTLSQYVYGSWSNSMSILFSCVSCLSSSVTDLEFCAFNWAIQSLLFICTCFGPVILFVGSLCNNPFLKLTG